MATIDINSLSINPEEAKSLSQAIFEKAVVSSKLNKNHLILTGVKYDEQIPFLGNLGLVGEAQTSCSITAEGSVAITDKTWMPKLVGFRLSHCATDLDANFKLFVRKANASGWFDETDDEVMKFLTMRSVDAVDAMVKRFVWFGDTDADNVADGGVITNGVDVKKFNAIDGIFKQIFEDVAGGKSKVTISENAVSGTTQMVLGESTALETLRALYNTIDPRAFNSELKYYITRSLSNNLWDYLEDKSLGFTVQYAVDGTSSFSYRGIPIEVMSEWDINLAANEVSGSTINKPHRALLTAPSNIPVGLLDEDSLTNIESFYDKTERKNYVDALVKMDVKVLESYMYAVAY